MLFQINEATEVTGFGGLAGPGSHFYPIIEMAAPCHLFHLYMVKFEAETCLHVNHHFLATQIEPTLELTKGAQVESVSIFIHRKGIEGAPELDLIYEIYKLRTESESSYVYLLKNGEEVHEYLRDSTEEIVKKTLVYRDGDSSFWEKSEAENLEK